MRLLLLALAIAAFAPGLLAATPAAEPDTSPALTAHFETSRFVLGAAGSETRSSWRYWRRGDRVETLTEAIGYGEAWTRSKQGVGHEKIFVEAKRRIVYTPGDLAAVGRTTAWEAVFSIVRPEMARSLVEIGSESAFGRPALRFRGKVGSDDIELLWLVAEQIPAELRIVRGGSHVELVRLVELDTDAPFVPAPSDARDFEALDFADLGDLEADPFVQRFLYGGVQAILGRGKSASPRAKHAGHAHGHDHDH